MIRNLILLGASGDLTRRLLLPSLVALQAEGALPEGFRVLGLDRRETDDEGYRAQVAADLAEFASDVDEEHRAALAAAMHHRRADVTSGADLAEALRWADGPAAVYLALPPALFGPVLTAVADAGLGPGCVVAIEKPFGQDLEDARALNALLDERLPNVTVFRNDHFLHAQTVHNVLGLRLGNQLFEPLWSARHIERVEIVWEESLTLEGRAAYYDRSGAARDMLQNHLLQVLCLVAMEPPATLQERDLRDARLAVLRAVGAPDPASSVRARYTAGRIGDREVPDYVAEPGVDPRRETETFAQVTLQLGNWRWAGVPFVLRSGKAFERDRMEIRVVFRAVPHVAFPAAVAPAANVLRIELEPGDLHLGLNLNAEGELLGLAPIELHAHLPSPARPPYAGLLLDVLRGDPTLAVRGDEAEQAWRIMEPVLQSWSEGEIPMRTYPAGSDGPSDG